MQEQYRLLVDEQLICGTQIHVGVADRELAVEIAQRIARHLPVLLALSASSPYWNGQDTGYAVDPHDHLAALAERRRDRPAARTRPSTTGCSRTSSRSGVIADAKMAYFDVRPSSHAPDPRAAGDCDACPLVDDAVLIAGLFRAIVRTAELEIERGRARAGCAPLPAPPRRASGRPPAAGSPGRLLDDTDHPRPRPRRRAPCAALIGGLRAALEEAGRLRGGRRARRDGARARQLRRPPARRRSSARGDLPT